MSKQPAKMDIKAIGDRWFELIPFAIRHRVEAAAVLDELTVAYQSHGRHYHTLSHIGALLTLVEQQRTLFRDRDTVELAIFFHDAIYDIARNDNEAASAELARSRLGQLGLAPTRIGRIAHLIEATAHMTASNTNVDGDLARFLDLDLSILGTPRKDYESYARAIRKEFAVYSEASWKAGRAKVLKTFLARRRLYLCDDLQALWDAPARANLHAELAALT